MRWRIAYAISRWGVGGTPRHLLEMLAHLDGNAFQPALYCLDTRWQRETLRGVRARGIEILDGGLRASSFYNGPALAALCMRMAAELRRRRVAILHTYLLHANLAGALAGRLARVPVVLVSKRSLDHYRTRDKRLASRLANRLAHGVTVPAAAVGRHLQNVEGCPPEKIFVIPNGIDPTRVPTEGPCGSPVVGTVGRLEVRKGQADLLAAAPGVLERVPGARFLLVGDGPEAVSLARQAAAMGLGSEIDMRGMVPDGAGLLSEMSVFVLPSHVEGMSNALLEAMAAGLPVVATDVGGNGEVVVDGQTGVLVPPRDPRAMAEAIALLLKDPERARGMGAAGRARVLEHFTVDRMVARHQALYTSLLGGRGHLA